MRHYFYNGLYSNAGHYGMYEDGSKTFVSSDFINIFIPEELLLLLPLPTGSDN